MQLCWFLVGVVVLVYVQVGIGGIVVVGVFGSELFGIDLVVVVQVVVGIFQCGLGGQFGLGMFVMVVCVVFFQQEQ